jgi:acyl carrier protein
MRGAEVLDGLLGDDRPLDFLALFSWLEPPAAVKGRTDLRAACAFLDALAQRRAARGAAPAVAIDWTPGVGFGTDAAFEVFDRILARHPAPQVAVIAPLSEEPEARPARTVGRSGEDDIPDEDMVARRIAEIWREVLGVERIGLSDRFFDLGGDSLIALQVMARLRDSFPVELPVRTLFERPSVAELRDALEEALTAKLEALSEEEAERLAASFLS